MHNATTSAPIDRPYRWIWWTLLAVVLVVPNWFAFTQLRATGGFLFYSNAFDEPTYLSYDGALMTRSISHLAEHLVVLLHRVGLSGGYINLVLDLLAPGLTVVVIRRIALRLGFSPLEAIVYPFLVVAVPVLFGYANPYYGPIFDQHYRSATLTWLTLPQAYYPPFFRSPEPQLSWLATACATAMALRWRSYWPPLVVAPFLYPFLAMPVTFVTLALTLSDRRVSPMPAWLAAGIGYLAVTAVVTAFYLLVARNTGLDDFLPKSRLPLISGTGLAALLLYAIARPWLDVTLRRPALFLAAAPTVVVNTQLISGFLEQPNSFEQNFGVVVVAIMLVFVLRAVDARTLVPACAAAAACALLWMYSQHVFRVNHWIWQRVAPSADLVSRLRDDAQDVVIGDPDLADVFSLIAPRVHFSALAHAQVLRSEDAQSAGETTADRFNRYLCTRALLRSAAAEDVVPDGTFTTLDRGFEYLGQDFPLVHLNRSRRFRRYFDSGTAPTRCAARELALFPSPVLQPLNDGRAVEGSLAREGEWEHDGAAATLVTPPAQWGRATGARLGTTDAAGLTGVADVRVSAVVERGCLEIGVMNHDGTAALQTASLAADVGRQTVDVLFSTDPRGQSLAIRNCAADGASRAMIESVELFRVAGVTVRPMTMKGISKEPIS